MPPSNKLHNLKGGAYQKSHHNQTVTKLKCL